MDTQPHGPSGARTAASGEVIDRMNDLLQLDHDAIGAYEVAIDKLNDRTLADRISEFKHDHERHIVELNEVIAALGGSPKNEPHATGPFKQALQSLGGLAGDKGLLMAWRTNELQVKSKYASASSDAADWPAEAHGVVQRNALDEERHYRWVVDALQRLGAGGGDTPDDGSGRLEQARDRAREAAEGARERVAGGLAAVGGRLSDHAEGGGAARGFAERVGGGLQSAAHQVREGEVSEIGAELEARVRRSPAQTLLAAAAAGFILGRILRR